MAREGIRDLRVVEQSFQSLAVLGEVEVSDHRNLSSAANESRLLEGSCVESGAGQMSQLREEEISMGSFSVDSESSRLEQDQQSGQQPANMQGKEEERGWGCESWQQDSWNSSDANEQSSWDQDWPAEAASSEEQVVFPSASSSGWGLLPGETASAPYVDLGYYDQEIAILGSNLKVRVAYTAKGVEDWIGQYSASERLFGVDIEWRPNHFKGEDNQAALLQIAGKHGCLIVQLLYIDHIPDALKELLNDPSAKLAGVGVRADTKKLFHDYGLRCRGEVDLGLRAADVLNRRDLKRAGLAKLCELVLGIPFKKIKSLTVSNWAAEGLSLQQITYAASDACIAYSLLVTLNAKSKEKSPAKSPREGPMLRDKVRSSPRKEQQDLVLN